MNRRELVGYIEELRQVGDPEVLRILGDFALMISRIRTDDGAKTVFRGISRRIAEELEELIPAPEAPRPAQVQPQLGPILSPTVTPPNLTREQKEQVNKLSADYTNTRLTLDLFELSVQAKSPQPTFDQIKAKLTPEMLDRIKLLHEPTLICVPTRNKQGKPIRFQELAQSLDKAKTDNKTTGEDTYVWNEIASGTKVKYKKGNSYVTQSEYYQQSNDWEVWVVEGAQAMPTPDKLSNQKFNDFPTLGTNQEKFDYMLKKYDELNLQGITYEMWAILLMDYLRQRKVIDKNTYTCFLSNMLDVNSALPAAIWSNNQPFLSNDNADLQHNFWRSRGAVRVM